MKRYRIAGIKCRHCGGSVLKMDMETWKCVQCGRSPVLPVRDRTHKPEGWRYGEKRVY